MRKNFEFEGMLSILIGVLLLFIPTTLILNILKFILGFYLVFAFLPAVIMSFVTNSKTSYVSIKSLLMVILGIVIMCFGINHIGMIVGLILLVFLIIDLVNSSNKKERFKKDLVKYIIVFVLVVLGIELFLHITVRIMGLLILISGIILLITNSKNNKNSNKNNTSYTNSQTLDESVIDVDFTEE